MQSPLQPLADSLQNALTDIFGFETFRDGQQSVMEAIKDGHDALVVMPTGAGKSLCYQLPACVVDGLTLVVSPLIALMKDQVDFLCDMGIAATFINSSIPYDEQRERIIAMQRGEYKIVYVAPERFRNQRFCHALSQIKIGLLAIDEAHCISQWGHDFRPDYLTLGNAREALNNPPTVALTATATGTVQSDILKQLQLSDAKVFVSGFARPNLYFSVTTVRSQHDKLNALELALKQAPDNTDNTALIYCSTRKQVEEVSRHLAAANIKHGIYHAGIGDDQREHVQNRFMRGDVDIMVATNAFGMGVDKADIRTIIHYQFPGSIEAYYQEAGRAGRDGKPARCILFYHFADKRLHEWFADNSYPERIIIEKIWLHLCRLGEGTHTLIIDDIAEAVSYSRGIQGKVHPWAVEASLRFMERNQNLAFGMRDGNHWVHIPQVFGPEKLRINWAALANRRALEDQRIQDMVEYVTRAKCRQYYLIDYFHQRKGRLKSKQRCDNCDLCCHDSNNDAVPATYVETLKLLKSGKSYQRIANLRGLTTSSVIRHILFLADKGHPINLEQYIDPDLLNTLRPIAADWQFGDAIGPLKKAMPASCTYDALKLHLAKLLLDRQQ